jgi:hypothetical protein
MIDCVAAHMVLKVWFYQHVLVASWCPEVEQVVLKTCRGC